MMTRGGDAPTLLNESVPVSDGGNVTVPLRIASSEACFLTIEGM